MHQHEITQCPDIAEKLESYTGQSGGGLHAVLAPSAAHRWVNCPGSVQAEQQYPDVESESSREGTAAHWVGEQVLTSYQSDNILLASDLIGQAAPNGVVINDEMVEGADLYVNDVLKRCQDGGYLQAMQIEQPVVIPRVHDLNWGTPDNRIWAAEQLKIIVWDFKYGRVMVECRENWQQIDYSIGILDEILNSHPKLTDEMITIEMRIVQPRAFHIEGACRDWTVQGSDLRTYANQLKMAADESQHEDPPCKVGEWCDNCSAARGCMTLQREDTRIADRIEALQLHDLTPENSAVELRYLRRAKTLLESRLKALETQSMEQIKGGTSIPGFGIGHGRGSVIWNKPNVEVIALGDLLGIQLRKSEALITPTQAKKLNVDEAVINSYSEKRQGAARLVATDETIASRIFSK